MLTLCEVLDSTVSDMLLNSEESEPIIKIVTRIGVVTGHVLRQFQDFFDVYAISRITGKIIHFLSLSLTNSTRIILGLTPQEIVQRSVPIC